MSWLYWDNWPYSERDPSSEIDVTFKAKWRDRLINLGSRNGVLYERNIEIDTPYASAPAWQPYDGSNPDLPIATQHIWVPPWAYYSYVYAWISWGSGTWSSPAWIYARLFIGTVYHGFAKEITSNGEKLESHLVWSQLYVPEAIRGTVQPCYWEARRDKVISAIGSSVNIGPASGRTPQRSCRLYWRARY